MPADKTSDDCSWTESTLIKLWSAEHMIQKEMSERFKYSEGKEKHLKWELWVKVAR